MAILRRNLLTGQLVHCNGTPICRPCWNGQHRKCKVQADEFNKCECATWEVTKKDHADAIAKRTGKVSDG